MWKFVSRGIRETLERRACRTNVYSQTSQEPNTKNEVKASLTCNHKFLAPSFSAFNKEFCGSSKTGGTKDKDYDSNYTKYTWSEAIRWSSVLAVGWVVCQTLCLRRRLFENEKTDFLKNKLSQFPEARISYLFGQVLNFKPTNILPLINCLGNNKIYAQENNEANWEADKPFGPITIDEALKEATDEFANTHQLAMAEFELYFGLRALEERRYKDAIKHFTSGAHMSSAASMFNLGLCHELGLGTLVDHKKAAKCYNDAAEQGHADATYNLGVFHAQGKGGFTVDIDRARSYFIKAAKLGQTQAQHALDLEKHYSQTKEHENDTLLPKRCENTMKYLPNKNINNILKKLSNYSNVLSTQSEVEFLKNSGCEQAVVESRNSTELFLDMLGLKESDILAVPAD